MPIRASMYRLINPADTSGPRLPNVDAHHEVYHRSGWRKTADHCAPAGSASPARDAFNPSD